MKQAVLISVLGVVAMVVGVACSNEDSPTPSEAEVTGGSAGYDGPGPVEYPQGTGGGSTASSGGTGGYVANNGTGLTSSVFGSLEDLVGEGGAGNVVACDYGDTPTCDYTRIDGCCAHLACLHATDDPDDAYPIQACESLLTCVQTNDCTTAEYPVCFTGEHGSTCDDEAYDAGHSDEDTPFHHAVALMNCICGYDAQ